MPSTDNPPQPAGAGPAQVLSLGDATAIIVGLIVGAGIFGTPSIVANRAAWRAPSAPYPITAIRTGFSGARRPRSNWHLTLVIRPLDSSARLRFPARAEDRQRHR